MELVLHPLTAEMQRRLMLEGISPHSQDGRRRMHWYRQAWAAATGTDGVHAGWWMHIEELGKMIEPAKNVKGFRISQKIGAPHPNSIEEMLRGLYHGKPEPTDYHGVATWLAMFNLIDPFPVGTYRVALIMEAKLYQEFNPTKFMAIKAKHQTGYVYPYTLTQVMR
jgi:hypothetical protein